jgi:hypothetical protein
MSPRVDVSNKKLSLNHFNRQLSLYSLAAAAAGVSILAAATPAESEVVVTQKTIQLQLSYLGKEGTGISFQNNGVDDLELVLSSFSVFGNNGNSLKAVNASEGEGVVGQNRYRGQFAVALAPGASIGPARNFLSAACRGSYFSCAKAVRLAATHTSTFGPGHVVGGNFAGDDKTAYLGVRFLIDGETHYGWVRLTVNTTVRRATSATVTAYAYETEANTPIFAGMTKAPTAELHAPERIQNQAGPSLGMLAVGAEAVPLWRRNENSTSK